MNYVGYYAHKKFIGVTLVAVSLEFFGLGLTINYTFEDSCATRTTQLFLTFYSISVIVSLIAIGWVNKAKKSIIEFEE